MIEKAIIKALKNVEGINNLCIIGNGKYLRYLDMSKFQEIPYKLHVINLDEMDFQKIKRTIQQYGENLVLVSVIPFLLQNTSKTEVFDWQMEMERKGVYGISLTVGCELVNATDQTQQKMVMLLQKILGEGITKEVIKSKTYHEFLKEGEWYKITDTNGSLITYEVDKVLVETDMLKPDNRVIQLPAGEVFVVPKKGTVNGRLMLRKGSGMREIKIERDWVNMEFIEKGLCLPVSEVGFGTNQIIPAIYNIPYLEKRFGTFHLGFGNNVNFGGEYKFSFHFDIVSNAREFQLIVYEKNSN